MRSQPRACVFDKFPKLIFSRALVRMNLRSLFSKTENDLLRRGCKFKYAINIHAWFPRKREAKVCQQNFISSLWLGSFFTCNCHASVAWQLRREKLLVSDKLRLYGSWRMLVVSMVDNGRRRLQPTNFSPCKLRGFQCPRVKGFLGNGGTNRIDIERKLHFNPSHKILRQSVASFNEERERERGATGETSTTVLSLSKLCRWSKWPIEKHQRTRGKKNSRERRRRCFFCVTPFARSFETCSLPLRVSRAITVSGKGPSSFD